MPKDSVVRNHNFETIFATCKVNCKFSINRYAQYECVHRYPSLYIIYNYCPGYNIAACNFKAGGKLDGNYT